MMPHPIQPSTHRSSGPLLGPRRLWVVAALGVLLGLFAEIGLPAFAWMSVVILSDEKDSDETIAPPATGPTCCNNCGCSDSARSGGVCCCTGRNSTFVDEEDEAGSPARTEVGCPCGQLPTDQMAGPSTVKIIAITVSVRWSEAETRRVMIQPSSLPEVTVRPETPPPEIAIQNDRQFV